MCRTCANIRRTNNRNKQSDAQILFQYARTRANARGREFTITLEDVEAVDTDICPILNIPIKRYMLTANTGKKPMQRPDTKTLDRIDASKGYVPGNIRIISWKANYMLNSNPPTIKEVVSLLNYLINHHGSQI